MIFSSTDEYKRDMSRNVIIVSKLSLIQSLFIRLRMTAKLFIYGLHLKVSFKIKLDKYSCCRETTHCNHRLLNYKNAYTLIWKMRFTDLILFPVTSVKLSYMGLNYANVLCLVTADYWLPDIRNILCKIHQYQSNLFCI